MGFSKTFEKNLHVKLIQKKNAHGIYRDLVQNSQSLKAESGGEGMLFRL